MEPETPAIPWLNGWPRMDNATVLVGATVQCICCGAIFGVATVIVGDRPEPGAEPSWPFTEATCPMEHAVKRRAHLANRGVSR